MTTNDGVAARAGLDGAPHAPSAAVAILGGGLAGLNAAWRLHCAGVDVRLFEARTRLGGRILTVDDTGAPADDGFDLGPSWVWPGMQPALGALIDRLGLPAFEQFSDGSVLFERSRIAPAQRYPGLRQEPPSMRIAGGTAALIRALSERVPPERIHLGARVTALRLTGTGAELTVAGPHGVPQVVTAGHVIAALPPRLLAASVAFTPALAAHDRARWETTPTWMAPHAKFFALYDRPFWRDAGLSGTAQSMVGPLAEIHDATTASGRAALFGFVGIDPAGRARQQRPALIRACVDQLARLFGPGAANPRATLLKDWAADALTATPADLAAPGHPEGGIGRAGDPWRGVLCLAGSEASAADAGYLAGALAASDAAVARVLPEVGGNGDRG